MPLSMTCTEVPIGLPDLDRMPPKYRQRRLRASGRGQAYFVAWLAKHPCPRKQRSVRLRVKLWHKAHPPVAAPVVEEVVAAPIVRPKVIKPRDPRLPPVGTTIKRPWLGKTIDVEVLEKGFRCEGKVWGSLSKLGSSIAKVKAVNGFLWFGLIPGKKMPAPPKRKRVPIR